MSLPLFSLFLAIFAVGTTEFVITGILPDVAADLGVSIPTAGYLISGYAAGVAIGGPIVAILTANFERKATLLGLLGIFILGNVLCALAPSYGWLMAARIVISFSHGACFGIAIVAASAIVSPDRRGFAISVVLGGVTVANILGVPAGTAIGNAFGWRFTFWAVSVVGAIALACVVALLPRGPRDSGEQPGLAREIRVLGRQEVYLSFLMIVIAACGFFSLFAFIAPLVVNVSGLPPSGLPYLLSLFGVGALLGNIAGGRLADKNLMLALTSIFAGMLVVDVVLLFTVHALWPAVVALFVWSFVNFAFAAPVQARILRGAADAPNLASTLVSTAFNIGISSGAAIGAWALAHGADYSQIPWVGVITAALSLVLALVARGIDRRTAAAAA